MLIEFIWDQSMITYEITSKYYILWNAVTSLDEKKVI